MRKTLAIAGAVSLVLAFTSGPARACGDTSIEGGHAAFCAAASTARGSVLVFQDPGEPGGSLLADPDLSGVLTSAGFKPRVVLSLEAVKQALSEQSFDVVLAGVGNAPALKDLLAASSGKTALVPVVHKGTKEEASAARGTYGSVVTSPTRARSLVRAIDDASGS